MCRSQKSDFAIKLSLKSLITYLCCDFVLHLLVNQNCLLVTNKQCVCLYRDKFSSNKFYSISTDHTLVCPHSVSVLTGLLGLRNSIPTATDHLPDFQIHNIINRKANRQVLAHPNFIYTHFDSPNFTHTSHSTLPPSPQQINATVRRVQ